MTLSQILSRRISRIKSVKQENCPNPTSKSLKKSKSLLTKLNLKSHRSPPKSPFRTTSTWLRSPNSPSDSHNPNDRVNDTILPYTHNLEDKKDCYPETSKAHGSQKDSDILFHRQNTLPSLKISIEEFEIDPDIGSIHNTVLIQQYNPTKNAATANQKNINNSDGFIFNITEKMDTISFDNDILSHSTSKNNSISDPNEHDNLTDFESLSDTNFQIFKYYSESKAELNLFESKQVKCQRQPEPKQSLPYSNGRFLSSIYPSNSSPKLEFKSIRRSSQTSQASLAGKFDIFSNNGRFDNASKHTKSERESSSDVQVYRHELISLIEKHNIIVSKQQQKINHLRNLLTQERRINAYLSSPKSTPKPTTSTTNNECKRVRSKFIPISIAFPGDPKVKPPSMSLLPPFKIESEKRSQGNIHLLNEKLRDPTTLKTSIMTTKANPTSSSSSSVYFSALEEYDQQHGSSQWVKDSPVPLGEVEEIKRSDSFSSSISSVMSTSHNIPYVGSFNENKKTDSEELSKDSVTTSNFHSSYTIHSHLTTPDSLNLQSGEFYKFPNGNPNNNFSAQFDC